MLQAIASRLIRVFRSYMAKRASGADEMRRIDTVGSAFRYFASVVVVLVAGMLVLSELGISIAPILATAGVAGIAIAFGAQSLIKDYFTGFFLLVEDQIRQGDVVEIAGKSGEVEEVTLRYVRLRDGDGYVHFVPNGEIKVVVNRTRTHAFANIDVGVPDDADLEAVFQAMRDVGRRLARRFRIRRLDAGRHRDSRRRALGAVGHDAALPDAGAAARARQRAPRIYPAARARVPGARSKDRLRTSWIWRTPSVSAAGPGCRMSADLISCSSLFFTAAMSCQPGRAATPLRPELLAAPGRQDHLRVFLNGECRVRHDAAAGRLRMRLARKRYPRRPRSRPARSPSGCR